MRRWAICAIIFALLAVGMPALSEGDGNTTYRAMLVGIDNYASSALEGCVTDANRMLATLQTANEAGSIYQQPVIRTNLKTEELYNLLTEMTTWGVDDDDVTFWYFAGHGHVSDKDVVSIVGADAKILRVDRLKAALDEVPGTKIVVLDCRYADSLVEKSGLEAKDVLEQFNGAVADVFLADPEHYYVLSGTTLASSITAAGASVGGGAHGLVTYYLTEACGYDYNAQSPGDLKGDADGNGAVSLAEAKTYIESALAAQGGAPQVQVLVSPADSGYPVLARRAQTDVLKVELSRPEMVVAMDYTAKLEASVQPANASQPGLKWSSSDLAVATVDSQGVVTGVRPGTAQIVAISSNGLADACEVTVRDVVFAENITLEQNTLVLGEGTARKLSLLFEPADADEQIEWSTDDATVATVDGQGNVSAKGLGDAVITATTERGKQATAAIKVVNKGKEVSSIELSEKSVELYEGNAQKIEYRLEPKEPEDELVTWVSSDSEVAYVDNSGLLIAEKPGEVTVTAYASSGVSASVQVMVKGAELSISPDPVSMKKGNTEKLTAAILPSGLLLETTWRSADPEIATVSEDGTVTAVENGMTTVTAALESGVEASVMVSVVEVPIKGVKVNPEKLKMTVGGQRELQTRVTPDDASIKTLFWSSSEETVATVDENGTVTALSPGKTVINVQAHNGKKARCLLEVEPIKLKNIRLSETSVSLMLDGAGEDTIQLTAETDPASAGANAVAWASNNEKVATVDENGLVTAVGTGEAIIRAKSGKVKADCKITVTGNEAIYKKAVVGKDRKVYVSARRIQYEEDSLIVEVYFVNRTRKTARLPYAGTLVLTLADGQTFELREIEKGTNGLMAGKTNVVDYKISLEDRPELTGLDLRGASATILRPEEMGQQGEDDFADVDDVLDDGEDAGNVLDTSEAV
jgi:uncharacterized protein YjdB